ncbi:hypothetical protein P153DRAFT_400949 [Dothidotthia symphoricarpi CBS 119687]|uniref:CHRD domain-containing protein n=1 Tax=Dothidotthia symphoricarpi CBS 119687 TaxID=1392245 RepID=A0A6A5ZZ82_9PLEO|nr:uncharacterized protein P153DRAFT_400949 [Dothidotthia symphoricarpi CBS 119687]KAF2124879.1 hypothetical protein P153DRAFT_400949 [Dothidotthia symphoricarpi CBS 119687]
MLFTKSAVIAFLSATIVTAAPTNNVEARGTAKYDDDCKKDFDNKWKNDDWEKNEKIFYFNKEIIVKAGPGNVVNNSNVAVPGQPGGRGIFKFGINVEENTICYNITLNGVTGNYMSPALTATHIHEGIKGRAGPPRLAFPNPTGPDSKRVSYGCLTGPFRTGINATGTTTDTGASFHVRQIVANPAGFFCDTHTAAFPAGAIRGQLA